MDQNVLAAHHGERIRNLGASQRGGEGGRGAEKGRGSPCTRFILAEQLVQNTRRDVGRPNYRGPSRRVLPSISSLSRH